MMDARKRLEKLEAAHSTPYETPPEVALYFKQIENARREQAREPPIPLTPEEERMERARDNDPEFRAYMERISEQRKERLWREET